MSRARIALAVLLVGVLAAGYSYWRQEIRANSHRQVRQLVLYYTLSRVNDPIVVLGDSITEASTLPRTFCGHRIVNAGLNGASTSSDLGTWLTEALSGRRAFAVLVAVGTNDALLGHSRQDFETNYASLLAQLAGVTSHLVVLGIPAIEIRGRVTSELRSETMERIDAFNALLPALAARHGASFVALPPMPSPHTIDGVHLDDAGYGSWEETVLKGASSACANR